MRHPALLAAATVLALAAPLAAQPAPAAATARADQSAALNAFFDAYDKAQLARSPQRQSYRGIKTDYDKWDDASDAAELREHEEEQRWLADMRVKFAGATLNAQAKLSYDLFEKQAARRAAAFRFRRNDYVFDQMSGAQSQLPAFLINIHRVTSKADLEAYVARLNGLGTALDQNLAESDTRAKMGVQPPKWVYPYVISDARNMTTGAPFQSGAADSPLYADFKAKLAALNLPKADGDRLTAAATRALTGSIQPAYQRLISAMERQEKTAPSDDGIWRLKDGAAYYAERLGYYTTTDLTPEQVHALGLKQVARIHDEMRGIMKQVGFKGDLRAFFKAMREDKRFYLPETPEGRDCYIAEATALTKAMEAKLPEYFGTLPKAPVVIKAVEPFREKSAGKAFYQAPAPDGSRPGTYYVNLYKMADMPLTEMDALAYHEGVPGHHLDRTISVELKDVPAFRKFGGFTAFSEGWGLYSEKLAKDMGFYTDPYRDFGRLQLELHRAMRLVVDTGLHHKRWTRAQAIQYVLDNSADAPGGVQKAIERYAVYPGQATAYMVGRLKIVELRDKARQSLGDRFDIKGFHDAVLLSGAVPLDVLEANVDAWVARRRDGANSAS